MKTFFIFFFAFITLAHAEIFQYPENRVYTNVDRGMSPYQARSVYKTGTFTLTFDDGPHPTRTAKVLDVLKKHKIKATFFVLTSQVNQTNFYLIKRMLDEGHIVGSHGFNHDNSNDLTQDVWKSRVKKSLVDLASWYKKAGHEFTQIYYRFPYGAYGQRADYHHMNALQTISNELMGDNCIQFAFWDVDSSDWVKGMTAKDVAQNIRANFEGGIYLDFKKIGNEYVKVPVEIKNPIAGGVVLQHDIQEPSILGTDLFLTYAKERGLNIVRLDEVEEFRVTQSCRMK